MPQWQFKLFEFDTLDSYPHEKEDKEYISGKDNKTFVVQMFGIDKEGKTAAIYVTGFNPFFYIKVGNDWKNSDMIELVTHIKQNMGSYFEESLIKAKLILKHKLYGFDNKKLHKFVLLKFKNIAAFNKAKNLWYIDKISNGVFNRSLIPGGIEFKETKLELYEANIPPLLRLFHIKKISPSGWIALNNERFIQHKKLKTSCNYEFSVDYKYIIGLANRETGVPYKILSVDIEASSSHGDFPLPKKNYKKLATNIVDVIRNEVPSKELLKRCINTAFGLDNFQNIDIVFPKKNIEIINGKCEQIEIKFEEWIRSCPAKYAKLKTEEELTNQLLEENDKEDDDEKDEKDEKDESKEIPIVENFGFKFGKKIVKKYTKKEATIIEMLNDETAERDTKIQGLTDTLTDIFPKLKGDQVTFIGSSLRKHGEIKPYLKHCIVVGSCEEIQDVEVESYETEKEALLAWTKLIQKEDPDIIIGYNIHGWDFGFMYERSEELDCVKKFLKLSRNKNEVCLKKDWKTGKESIEENSLFIASGQYDIKFYKMTGRLQIDFLNLFRREEQLPSYKLDYVSSHFIGDDIKNIEIIKEEKKEENEEENEEENINKKTIIFSKNLVGLEKGDYIIIEEIGHTTDLYQNGKKFKICKLNEDSFEINEKINPDITKKLRWCLGKDDVTPQDIFRLTNEGPKGRAIVGKYCIKDTTLIHDLMRKVDTMTGYVEMAKLSWVPMSFLVFRGQGIKLTSYVAQKCREKDTLMPVIEKTLDDEGFEGATVLEPKNGLYLDNPIACVDYSSLYPSSIISENLSHDSKVWTKEFDLEGNLLKEWYSVEGVDNVPDGYEYIDITYDTFKWIRKTPKAAKTKELSGYKICRFAQFSDGKKAILPSILEELLAARKATKKLMKEETDPFMENVLDKRQLAIKVTANSLYGQCGAKTSTFFEKDVAASTTATGRKLLMYAKKVIEDNYGDAEVETKNYGKVKTKAETVYGDSVANYTPIYVLYNKKHIDICTIEELGRRYGNNEWKICNEKGKRDKLSCELENIETWTEKGWTKCYRIIKHKLASHKKIIRIATYTGIVDVTDDHSLLKENGEVISPKDIKIGTKLMHNTITDFNKTQDYLEDKTNIIQNLDINIVEDSQIKAALQCYMGYLLGYHVYVNLKEKKYQLIFKKEKNLNIKCTNKVKSILEILDYINEDNQGYVYDLTTDNHHFAAGIGNIIVHNTDSAFFTFNLHDMQDNRITEKKALIITIELAQEVSKIAKKELKRPHDLEYEKTFLPFCLLSKKRYVGMLYEFDPEKCKRKSMGIVLKRRDNAPIVKDIYGGVIDILMNDKIVYKAVNFVKESLQNVIDEKFPLEKLIVTKSLRSNYKNPMQIAHNVLAIRMGERDPGNKPGPGDRIPFAFIKNENKKALQGERIEHPKFILDNNLQLDYGFYITNQIMKPLQQLFALVLEEISDFRSKRGRQNPNKPHGTWERDINKLKEKWVDEEKLKKKYEEFRCKEVKTILFDPYINLLK